MNIDLIAFDWAHSGYLKWVTPSRANASKVVDLVLKDSLAIGIQIFESVALISIISYQFERAIGIGFLLIAGKGIIGRVDRHH